MQTGITYEHHNALSTKTSDLLDTMFVESRDSPVTWGQSDSMQSWFWVAGSRIQQYKLSSFSPMRLTSTSQSPVYYPGTNAYYSNITAGLGSYLLMLITRKKSLNYSTVSKLLGINGTYGFQLTLTPTVTFSIEKIILVAVEFSVNVAGTGFRLQMHP